MKYNGKKKIIKKKKWKKKKRTFHVFYSFNRRPPDEDDFFSVEAFNIYLAKRQGKRICRETSESENVDEDVAYVREVQSCEPAKPIKWLYKTNEKRRK